MLDHTPVGILALRPDGISDSMPGLLSHFLKAFFLKLLVRRRPCLIFQISHYFWSFLAGIALVVGQKVRISEERLIFLARVPHRLYRGERYLNKFEISAFLEKLLLFNGLREFRFFAFVLLIKLYLTFLLIFSVFLRLCFISFDQELSLNIQPHLLNFLEAVLLWLLF